MDNLAASYNILDMQKTKGGQVGISAAEYTKLVKSLCQDFPEDTIAAVLQVLDIDQSGHITFQEFAAGINACLIYSDFLECAEDLYSTCAKGRVTVSTEQYLGVMEELRLANPGLTMPSPEELASAVGQGVEVTFNDFLVHIFCTCSHTPAT